MGIYILNTLILNGDYAILYMWGYVMSRKLKIGIIGATPEGKALAVFLGAHYDVELVYDNTKHIQIDNGVVIDVVGVFGTKAYLVPCVKSPEDFTSKKDIIFVMSRAYDTARHTKMVVPYLGRDGIVVTRNNTLNFDEIAQVVDKSRWVGMFLEWSAAKYETYVAVDNDGNTIVGAYSEEATKYLPAVQKVLNNISPTFVTKDMMGFIISRSILNIPIAILGGITGLTLGKVLEKSMGKKLFVRIIKECIDVCDKVGIKVYAYNNVLDYRRFVSGGISNMMYRNTMLTRIRVQNSEIRSSILISLEKNKKSEMEYLIGKIVKYAESYNVDVPVNARLYKMMTDIENQSRGIYEENLYDDKLMKAMRKK